MPPEYVKPYHLVGRRRDSQDRCIFRHLQHPQRWYCLLDPYASHGDLFGEDLYRKRGGPDSDPVYLVYLDWL